LAIKRFQLDLASENSTFGVDMLYRQFRAVREIISGRRADAGELSDIDHIHRLLRCGGVTADSKQCQG
jgi:hypothetical protein